MYRTAGKLNVGLCLTLFDSMITGILKSVQDVLLEGRESGKFIRAELNVHGNVSIVAILQL